DLDLEKVKTQPPKQAKAELAKIFIERFHDKIMAEKAEDEFNKIFSKRQIPSEIESYEIKKDTSLVEILTKNTIVSSGNEARRLIKQGAVAIDGEKIDDINYIVRKGGILKAGKRRFLKVVKL
ncbi:MAG: tyrosine--tRNA ligase, partial [Candidatus Omnitrophica bacterium]|nr:tyrosine--tRNA ligase [Candidatus Omnitrophota bacterium]